jgi:hypothetical protein
LGTRTTFRNIQKTKLLVDETQNERKERKERKEESSASSMGAPYKTQGEMFFVP